MSSDDPYNPLDMKSLLCFATMARLGSLTQASIELEITDAAVSQRIKSVEKHLGKKLYESRGGRIRLTEDGERTKAFAMRIFDELSEFEGDIREEEFRDTITVGAASHIFRYQFSKIVHAFREQHPHAQLRLLDRKIFETIDLVRRNEIELGLIPSSQSMSADLVFYPWRIFKAYVLVPRGHPLAINKIPTLEDLMNKEALQQYPQVVASSIDTQERRVKQAMERLGLPFNVALEVGNVETLKHYVAQGHGLAIVNDACLSEGDDADFHKIEIPNEFDSQTTYGVVVRRDKYLSSALKTLLGLLEIRTH